jgi:hypothetical protein
VRAPLIVAGARLRARPGRALLVVLGVAATSTVLVGVVGGSLIAQDRALRQSLAALPASQRAFRVDAFGLPPGQDYDAADRTARKALAALSSRPPLRATFFRDLKVDGELVELAGIDHLGAFTRLRSGRLPRLCRPDRCEVLQVGRRGRATLAEGGIHLVRTGRADLPDRALFGSSLQTKPTVPGAPSAVLLLVNGAAVFERLPALASFLRVHSWIAPLDPRRLHSWQVSSILARESRVQTDLARYQDTFQLSGPDDALLAARHDGRISAQRMVLIGGEISALLLGFALIAAIGLRRGLANESRRLWQRGAKTWQVRLAVGAEIAALTTTGVLIGAGLGVLAVLFSARAADLPGEAVLHHSVGTLLGLALVAAAWLAATVVVIAGVTARQGRRERRRVRLLDVAALGAVAAVALAVARGRLNADNLSSRNGGALLLLLPGLICFAAAVAAGRLLAPLMRLAERVARKGPTTPRLALLALARAPARTTVTVAFLVVSLGLALFTASYRATLDRGARDESAFSVPLDFVLSESPSLVRPLEVASLRRYAQLGRGVRAYPVVRQSADVAGAGTNVLAPTVLGLPADAVSHIHWRSDFSRLPQATIARRLAADGRTRLRGVPIPADARLLAMTVATRGDAAVSLVLVAEDASHQVITLELGQIPPGTRILALHLLRPGELRQIVALEVSPASAQSTQFAHRQAEAGYGLAPSGSAELGALRAILADGRSRTLTAWRGWLARGGARLGRGRRPRLSYVFTRGQTMIVRLPQPTDNRPLRVLVSPDVARSAPSNGLITLDFQDAQLPARIVGVARRFPDSEQRGEGFVIAEESRLATALDADAPGTGTPGELWLSVPKAAVASVERRLRRPPFSALELASRRDIRHALAADPLARGVDLTLSIAGLIALLLAALGFWVTTISNLRDERGEHFDLEAQGVSPEALRRQLRLRAVAVVGFGVLGGLALGLFLSRLVVFLVRVSAVTTLPEPPLRFQPAWTVSLVAYAAVLVAVAAVAELTVRHAFRGETPERASWSLE